MWQSVAQELRTYRNAGLAGLISEDTVRFTVARALVAAGVNPASLRVEWPHPVLRGSRIDLAAGLGRGTGPTALLELKYPREPNEVNAAWTMALGEVLKDFYRLALVPGDADRLFVYLETARLQRYMRGAARRYGLNLDTDQVTLSPTAAAALPTTAADILGPQLCTHRVTAQRVSRQEIDHELQLAVYLVDALPQPASAPSTQTEPAAHPAPAPAPAPEPSPPASRDGARQEILAAVNAVLTRSGSDTFTVSDVVAEIRRRGTGYAESTIRTMVTGHMCANAPDNAAVTYDDLERVDRGVYRLHTRTLRR